jgi:hypothetical protein
MYLELGAVKMKTAEIISAEIDVATNRLTLKLHSKDSIDPKYDESGYIELNPMELRIIRKAIQCCLNGR